MDLTGHGVSVLFPPLLPFTSSSTWDPGGGGGWCWAAGSRDSWIWRGGTLALGAVTLLDIFL